MEPPRPRQAKFFRPPPRDDVITRAELVSQLEAASGCRVVLVTAPAGFGKTTLLSSWIDEGRHPYAWLALDSQDNDPLAFWRDLVTALQALQPGVGRVVLDILRSGQPARVVECPVALGDELEAGESTRRRERLIVLDDYHLVDDPLTHHSVALLAHELPAGWQLVIAARTLPDIPLARMRAADEVAEIDQGDLAFTAAQSRDFMQRCGGIELDAEHLGLLHEKTEGWPAGLQLAALSMRRVADPNAFIEELGGENRLIEEYLTEEVLQAQDGPVRVFLETIAPLERFCADLCDVALREVPELAGCTARDMIDSLERENLFLVPLDHHREWYRFHHLFRELLLRRRGAAERQRTVARAAADWLQAKGLVDEALALVLEIGELQWADRLIAQGAGLRQSFELRNWLRRLPESHVANSPLLIFLGTGDGLQSGQPREAQYWLHMLRRFGAGRDRFCDDPVLNVELECYALLANAWIDISAGRADTAAGGAAAVGTRVDALPAEALSQRARLRLVQSELLFQAAHLDAAVRTANDGLVACRDLDMGRVGGALYNRIGECQALAGRLRDLDATVADGMAFVSATQAADQLSSTGYLEKLRAELLLERLELDEAREALLHLRERAQRESHHYLDLASGVLLTLLMRCCGKLEQGLSLAKQLIRLSEQHLIRLWFMPSPGALWARLNIETGNLHAAQEWARASGLSDEQPFNHLREHDLLVFGRILLAQGEHERSARLFERLRTSAAAGGRHRIELEASILQAVTALQRGDSGLEALSAALEIGAREGFVRPFIDEGPGFETLLTRAGELGVAKSHIAHLRQKNSYRGEDTGQLLSAREVDVLELLARGHANKEIAQALELSPNTIKTHTRNIYDKLGVGNRTQAVARAAVLGLL